MLALKELRHAQNMSQSELAKKVGCNQTAIGKYERGQLEPNIKTLKQLASIFNVSIDYLCDYDLSSYPQHCQSTDQSLSKDEKALLDAFRTLGPFEREAILIQIDALADKKSLIKK